MAEERKNNMEKTDQILMRLDEKSLLFTDSGAKLLAARQNMDKEATDSNKHLEPARKEHKKNDGIFS